MYDRTWFSWFPDDGYGGQKVFRKLMVDRNVVHWKVYKHNKINKWTQNDRCYCLNPYLPVRTASLICAVRAASFRARRVRTSLTCARRALRASLSALRAATRARRAASMASTSRRISDVSHDVSALVIARRCEFKCSYCYEWTLC